VHLNDYGLMSVDCIQEYFPYKILNKILVLGYDYLYHARNLIFNLADRGYKYKTLAKISRTVSKLNREDLIEYKNRNNNNNRFAIIDLQ
jgi:hypothetical protein